MTHPTITARIETTLLRGQNNREHHRVRAKRVAAEREATLAALAAGDWTARRMSGLLMILNQELGARVTLTRPYQVTPLDGDNLSASFKAVRDGVAEFLGLDDASDRLHWVYRQEPAVVLGKSKKPGKTRASPDRDTRPTVTIEVLPVARIDPQAEALAQALAERDAATARAEKAEAEADAAERREAELGLQVVAQAARLRLAEAVVREARYGTTLARQSMRRALAAWDAVPGDVGPVDLG